MATPARKMATPPNRRKWRAWRVKPPPRNRGTREPSAALTPRTSELASETPKRSTLMPKQMDPNPQAKPNRMATTRA